MNVSAFAVPPHTSGLGEPQLDRGGAGVVVVGAGVVDGVVVTATASVGATMSANATGTTAKRARIGLSGYPPRGHRTSSWCVRGGRYAASLSERRAAGWGHGSAGRASRKPCNSGTPI